MNRTRLWIYKKPELHNVEFAHKPNTNGGWYDDWWIYPNGTQFNQYGLQPYPEDSANTYAVRQNFGVNSGCTAKFAITIDGDASNYGGVIFITLGNTTVVIDPSDPIYAPLHFPLTIEREFTVSTPNTYFGYELVIEGSGDSIPGVSVYNWGIKKIELISIETENYVEVDTYSDLEVPVTYNVADVRDITKKDSNFSLSFDLPNTNRNAVLFDHIYEITDYNSRFELLKTYPCFLEVDNVRTFNGHLKIDKITINDDKEVAYTCTLNSDVIEFVDALGTETLRGNDNKLDDLDFSEYFMYLDADNWFGHTDMFIWDDGYDAPPTGEHPYGKGCYFAPVDRFDFGSRDWEVEKVRLESSEPINGLYRPLLPMYYDEMTPFLFYLEILEKMFEKEGFNFVSDFLRNTTNNSTTFEFDHIVYPAVNKQYVETNIEEHSYIVQNQLATGVNYNLMNDTWREVNTPPYPIIDIDNGSVSIYDNTIGNMVIDASTPASTTMNPVWRYTAPTSGVYEVSVNMPYSVYIVETSTTGGWRLYDDGTAYFNNGGQWRTRLQLRYHCTANNTDYVVYEDDTDWRDYESEYEMTLGLVTLYGSNFEWSGNISMSVGDYLYINYTYQFEITYATNNLQTQNWFLEVQATGQSQPFAKGFWNGLHIKELPINSKQITIDLKSTFYVGGQFDPTNILNPERRKIDLLTDLIKKFNLYIEDVSGKKNPLTNTYYPQNTFRIEPRDMYYELNPIYKDWTDRVDTNTIEIKRIDDYLYSELIFNDDNDKTYFTEEYANNRYKDGEYGERHLISPLNVSADNKVEIKTKIGQTMCGLVKKEDNQYLQCPFVFSYNNENLAVDKKYDDRMLFVFDLYRGYFPEKFGTEPSEQYMWGVYRRSNSNNPNEQWVSNLKGGAFATYCLLDHLNRPFSLDNADLNFGWASYYFQNLIGVGDPFPDYRNAYYTFYRKMVEDYNSVNARIMSCECYLSPQDIRDLQLSDTIIINGVAYHINKIKEWKNGDTPCKCEFIKVLRDESELDHIPYQKTAKAYTPKPTPKAKDKAVQTKINEQRETILKLQKTIATMDERLKKLEGSGSDGGGTTGEDGKEEKKDDYD